MKVLFTSLVILLIAVSLALLALEDTGYVLIQLHGWSIEVSFMLLALAVLILFVVFYYSLRIAGGTRRLPRRLRDWRVRRRERNVIKALDRGFLDLVEGRWEQAEERLLRYAGREAGVIGFLGAARAAQELGAGPRRDRYLQLACKDLPDREFALALAQAEMQLSHAQFDEAAANLKRLQGMAPKNRVVLTQLLRLYTRLEDWERLLELLPSLRRQQVVDPERLRRLELRAWIGLLEAPGLDSVSTVEAIWRRAPKEIHQREEFLHEYLHRLLEFGGSAEAEAVLHEAIERQWSSSLVYRYGLVEGADAGRQLRRAEAWLKGRDNDPLLLLTLGRLAKRNGLWGKARHYLERSAELGATAEAFQELAATLEAMGNSEAALKYYRRGRQAVEAEAHRLAGKSPDVQHLLPLP